MPKYVLKIVGDKAIDIEDERSLTRLANALAEEGCIITQDVTPQEGHPDWRKETAFFTSQVISIRE